MDARNKSGHDEGGGRVWLTGDGRQTPRPLENPGGPLLGFAQWLNRTAVDLFRA